MNWKRFFMALVVVFLGAYLLGFLIHTVLLAQEYSYVAKLFRAPQDMHWPFFTLAYLGFALGFVWIYAKGMDLKKAWLGQGLRYGAAVWLVVSAYGWLISFAVQPIGRRLVAKGMAFELIAYMLLGALTAGVYKPLGEKQPALSKTAASE